MPKLAAPAALALAALLMAASPALAQKTGPNGGPVVMAEDHPVEFVSTDGEIAFFVQDDDGKPLSTTGARGRAIIQQDGKTTTVSLAGAPPNRLVGALPSPLKVGAKIVFSTRLHGHALQARFEKM